MSKILFLLTLLMVVILAGLLLKDYQNGMATATATENFVSRKEYLQENSEKWYASGDTTPTQNNNLWSSLNSILESESSSSVCSSCGSLECPARSQGQCPLIGRQPWREYRETPMNRKQDKEIEELREVLKDVVSTLKDEEVIPPGSIRGCAKPPIVAPDGSVIPSPECRPPGWLRFMEKRNRGEIDDDNV